MKIIDALKISFARPVSFPPQFRNEMGSAPAPGAVFRALAENSGRLEKCAPTIKPRSARGWPRGRVQPHPGAGVLPNSGVRVQRRQRFQRLLGVLGLALLLQFQSAHAQVPQLINYQGKVQVGTTDFNGTGQFKFALVNGDGSITFWSNDGTSTAGSQPTAAVSLAVAKGIYGLQLGNTSLANMTSLSAAIFANSDVRLRVWFHDGTIGFQQLTPDQRMVEVAYAMVAGSVSGLRTEANAASGSTVNFAGAGVSGGATNYNRLG